jgi:hypothetical protein
MTWAGNRNAPFLAVMSSVQDFDNTGKVAGRW